MVVRTHTPRVINARQTILELILSDHPNECLTCSKNGYCSLQTMAKDLGIREAKYKGETTKPMMDLSPSVVRNMESASSAAAAKRSATKSRPSAPCRS